MPNILKGKETTATLVLANVCIAIIALTKYSPESTKPILVIVATAIGMVALYPMYLFLQKPRRYRITKVTGGPQTVYIIKYKGYLWWYNATRSNGKIITFLTIDEAMGYIKMSRAMNKEPNEEKQKVVYDSQDPVDNQEPTDNSHPTKSDKGSHDNTGTTNGTDKQSMETSGGNTDADETTNSPTPSDSPADNTATTDTSKMPATPTDEEKKTDNNPDSNDKELVKSAQNVTSMFKTMAKQQMDEDDPIPANTETKEKEQPAHTQTETTAEEKTDENKAVPDKTEKQAETPTTPSDTTKTAPQNETPLPENTPNTAQQPNISEQFFDVLDSYSNKKKTSPNKAEEKKEAEQVNIEEKENKREEISPREEGNKDGDKGDGNPQNRGMDWAQQVNKFRLTHGNDPALVTGSLTMIHQHRILEQGRMEASQNADGDAPDGKELPSSTQGKEAETSPHEDKKEEKVPKKTIKPARPSAEQRYLKSKKKADSKQKVIQTSLYDLDEFNDVTPQEISKEPPAAETTEDNKETAPSDPANGKPSSSGGHIIARKPETAATPPSGNGQCPISQNRETSTNNTPNGSIHNGNNNPTEMPPDNLETAAVPIHSPADVNPTEEDEVVDYGYTESNESPNVIIITPPNLDEQSNGEKNNLSI